MKLYRHTNHIFYEKQADCPSRSFETVEFPFSASPKADFVAWINNNATLAQAAAGEQEAVPLLDNPVLDQHVAKIAERKAAEPVRGPRGPRTADGVMIWLLDQASNAEIEQVFNALGARFHEAHRSAT